jgi:CheY-like chemotaxis protein
MIARSSARTQLPRVAEASTLELLTQLVAQVQALPVLVVASCRPAFAHARQLGTRADCWTRIALGPLPDAHAALLVEQVAGDAQLDPAPSGKIVARAAQARPDVIISDVMMPHMGGVAFMHALRRDSSYAKIPVALASAAAPSANGAAGFLRKPFGFDALLDLVRRLANDT